MLSDAQRELLLARLRKGRGEAPGGITRRPAGTTDLPLSFGQEQLWFMDRFAPGMPTYNIPAGLWLRGPLDAAAFGRALDGVVAHTAGGWGTPPTYHRPDDDLAHIDFAFMTAAIQSLVEPVRWLATSDFRPQWTPKGQPHRDN